MSQSEAQITEPFDRPQEVPPASRAVVREAVGAGEKGSIRALAAYAGLTVLLCQLIFVYAFFPSFDLAAEQLEGRFRPASTYVSKYAKPDLLQWSGAQSLIWVASLFAPETPVRFAPALVFFLVAGGFVTAMYRPARPGGMLAVIAVTARTGMRLWLSWFAGAAILLVYILTSSGGMESLRVSAGVTFDKPWTDISDALLSHWLVYIAWFALLGFLPMVGGGILGLLRTRFLTRPISDGAAPSRQGPQEGEPQATQAEPA